MNELFLRVMYHHLFRILSYEIRLCTIVTMLSNFTLTRMHMFVQFVLCLIFSYSLNVSLAKNACMGM
jgi:hypothetical protein